MEEHYHGHIILAHHCPFHLSMCLLLSIIYLGKKINSTLSVEEYTAQWVQMALKAPTCVRPVSYWTSHWIKIGAVVWLQFLSLVFTKYVINFEVCWWEVAFELPCISRKSQGTFQDPALQMRKLIRVIKFNFRKYVYMGNQCIIISSSYLDILLVDISYITFCIYPVD